MSLCGFSATACLKVDIPPAVHRNTQLTASLIDKSWLASTAGETAPVTDITSNKDNVLKFNGRYTDFSSKNTRAAVNIRFRSVARCECSCSFI
jgi:hypothetical protein